LVFVIEDIFSSNFSFAIVALLFLTVVQPFLLFKKVPGFRSSLLMVIGAFVRSGLRGFPTVGGPLLEFTRILKSERWARQLIKEIWDSMLQLWKERNEQINQADQTIQADAKKERLERRIHRCYEYSHNLKATERQRWFAESRQELMKREQRYLEAWVRTVERIIHITKRESRSRPKESRIMEQYFGIVKPPTTQVDPHNRPSTDKPRRFTQELNPD
jgi:hypothetical protein